MASLHCPCTDSNETQMQLAGLAASLLVLQTAVAAAHVDDDNFNIGKRKTKKIVQWFKLSSKLSINNGP